MVLTLDDLEAIRAQCLRRNWTHPRFGDRFSDGRCMVRWTREYRTAMSQGPSEIQERAKRTRRPMCNRRVCQTNRMDEFLAEHQVTLHDILANDDGVAEAIKERQLREIEEVLNYLRSGSSSTPAPPPKTKYELVEDELRTHGKVRGGARFEDGGSMRVWIQNRKKRFSAGETLRDMDELRYHSRVFHYITKDSPYQDIETHLVNGGSMDTATPKVAKAAKTLCERAPLPPTEADHLKATYPRVFTEVYAPAADAYLADADAWLQSLNDALYVDGRLQWTITLVRSHAKRFDAIQAKLGTNIFMNVGRDMPWFVLGRSLAEHACGAWIRELVRFCESHRPLDLERHTRELCMNGQTVGKVIQNLRAFPSQAAPLIQTTNDMRITMAVIIAPLS